MNPSELFRELSSESATLKTKLGILNQLLESKNNVTDSNILSAVSSVNLVQSLRILLVSQSKTVRTATMKVLRYYTKLREQVLEINRQNLHYFITRLLEKATSTEQERIQAMKLIRQFISIDSTLVPRSVVQGLRAIADLPEDPFHKICLDSLCEIALRNPQVVAHSNGFKTIFNALVDYNLESMQDSLVVTVLYILDQHKTRRYVRPGYDLRLAIAPLTDIYPPDTQDKEKKWKAVTRALIKMLKSWTGIISLTADPFGLKNLVDALLLPNLELREIILDCIYEIFRIAIPKPGTDPFKNDMTRFNDKDTLFVGGEMGLDLNSRTLKGRHNLLDNYISALLLAFIHHGLIENLIEIGNGSGGVDDFDAPPPPPAQPAQPAQPAPPVQQQQQQQQQQQGQAAQPQAPPPKDTEKHHRYVTMKATLLLGELLHLSNTLLPTSQCARLQTLPTLVKHAAAFNVDPRLRSRSSSMITILHQYAHLQSSASDNENSSYVVLTGSSKWRRLKGRDRRLDKIDDVKLRIDVQMEEGTLQSKIRETQVTVTKDYTRWNWDIISDLLDGPLNNPQHVASACKGKFIKRLLSFLRPKKEMFIKLTWQNQSMKYARMGCRLLEVLLSCDVGAAYLEANALVPEIGELLRQEVEMRDRNQGPMNQQRILKTMVREYFTLLGMLSSTQKGSEIMVRYRIFDYLLPMAELGRSDLTNLIMTSLDYNIKTESCPSRVLLRKALTSTFPVLRLRATRYLRALLRSGATDFADWGISLLVLQLNEADPSIQREVLSILDEACDDARCLESLIAKKPFNQLSKSGRDLLLRFLSSPTGYKYLSEETSFVVEEMTTWRKHKFIAYAVAVETSISDAFPVTVWRKKPDQPDTVVNLPPHFYGELLKTPMGHQLFRASGHFGDFVDIVKSKTASPLEKRGALWTLGHIGASTFGLKMLIDANFVPVLVYLTEKSQCLSLRGTCFYVLSLLSTTEIGREVLDTLGWESDSHTLICVPKDLKSSGFLTIASYDYQGSWAQCSPDVDISPSTAILTNSTNTITSSTGTVEFGDIRDDMKVSVINLSNHISAEAAKKNLMKIKTSNPEFFTSPSLMTEVCKLMELYFYRLPIRRFIYELFSPISFTQKDFDDTVKLYSGSAYDKVVNFPVEEDIDEDEAFLSKTPSASQTRVRSLMIVGNQTQAMAAAAAGTHSPTNSPSPLTNHATLSSFSPSVGSGERSDGILMGSAGARMPRTPPPPQPVASLTAIGRRK